MTARPAALRVLPLGRPALRGRTSLIGVLSALGGALVAVAVLALAGIGGASAPAPAPHARAFVAPGRAFAMTLPAGWTAVDPLSAARNGSAPLAALRRADHRGLILVYPAPRVRTTAGALASGLTRRLSARLPGFQPVGARIARLRAGSAFLYTFVRGDQVQSLTLAATGGRAYTIDSISAGDAPAVARQIGAIVGSFGPATAGR